MEWRSSPQAIFRAESNRPVAGWNRRSGTPIQHDKEISLIFCTQRFALRNDK